MRLTTEQAKIAEENHNLIYKFINVNNLDESEWYGCIAECLLRAIYTYNKDYGKLSTHFYNIASRELISTLRKQKDFLGFYNNIEESEESRNDLIFNIEDYLSFLDKEDVKIASFLEAGYKQSEIARKLEISQPAVHKKIIKIRKKTKEAIEDGLIEKYTF